MSVAVNATSVRLLKYWLTFVVLGTGTLKGYDALMNLVLDDAEETLQGITVLCSFDHYTDTDCGLFADEEGNESTRTLGLLVARGTLLVLISPVDGSEEITNPFVQQEEE